jgi:hypothetical protein
MPLMRRRPLLRAAAIGGGAYMAGKHTMGTQEPEAPAPVAAAPVAAPPAPAAPDAVAQLTQLAKLHEQGVLTDDEFAGQKAKVLAG